MPKIRGFKSDLWTNEDFVELSPYARLLWMGMWNYACDNGHLADKSKQIKMRVLPTDDVNCAELLRELEKYGRILREDGVITIPNFTKHQKPDKRYFVTCDLTVCTKPGADSQPETRGGNDEARSGHVVGSQGPHVEVNRSEVNRSDGEGGTDAGKPATTPRKKPAKHLPADWQPTDTHRAYCTEHGIDLNNQAARFRSHAEANDRRQANWNAAFTQWLLSAPEWARGTVKPATKPRALPNARDLELPPDGLTDEQYAAWLRAQRERRQG